MTMSERVEPWPISGEMYALYLEVREAMWPAARAGIRLCTKRTPDEVDVHAAVEAAFVELWNSGLGSASPAVRTRIAVGRARQRGIDRGRQLIREQEKELRFATAIARVEAAASVEDSAWAEEQLRQSIESCKQKLTGGQRDVLAATVEGPLSLKAWADSRGVSIQASHRTRNRALRALKKCIDQHRLDRR